MFRFHVTVCFRPIIDMMKFIIPIIGLKQTVTIGAASSLFVAVIIFFRAVKPKLLAPEISN